MITIEHLTKAYGSNEVLKDIQLQLDPGKVYGIIGENGAGKTTLFKCITGLEDYEGTIQSPYNPLKDHIGYLQSESYLFPKMTGREYLQLLCIARNISLDKRVMDEKNVFDLPLDQYAVNYSTGMKKKLMIMALLLQKNSVFILDEPFNGVDIQSNMVTAEIILKLKELGKTILISSHIFATLRETCDEIYLLKDGTFEPKTLKVNFDSLENNMKNVVIGDRIKRLGLS